MNLLPKIKRCPSCDTLNLISINRIIYDNEFKSLQEWILKKLFNCRKCKTKLGLFLHSQNQQEILIWIDWFKCQDVHYYDLLKLEKDKQKYLKYKSDKKYINVIKKIRNVQNKIRLDQLKLKVKFKIINKSMLVKHAY